jgi:hypothetical protein
MPLSALGRRSFPLMERTDRVHAAALLRIGIIDRWHHPSSAVCVFGAWFTAIGSSQVPLSLQEGGPANFEGSVYASGATGDHRSNCLKTSF